ncbi:MAG: hypothetical protein KDE33_14670 [Bacteroidetes bacterium]|nr:hypothetical protein [Bacteroidota bacterium]
MEDKEKIYSEKTSADKKAVGFDFQYYFFLWKILDLEPGQVIGWEVKDDVHIEIGKEQFYYQIKHTTQKNASGSSINLTTYDIDLWKTLFNWINIITDINDGRENTEKQNLFLNKTTFILATNKSSSKGNKAITTIVDFQNRTKNITQFISDINELKQNTEDEKIANYIEKLLSMDNSIMELFLDKIEFELDETDIFNKCKNAIKADKIPENRIDEVFRNLDSAIRKDNFISICQGKKVIISFDDFYIKYRKYYQLAHNPNLQIKPYDGLLPSKLEEQIFIKQLIDIEDVNIDNIEDIVEFTRYMLKMQINLDFWEQNGELTSEEINEFKSEAILSWKNEFRSSYRGNIPNNDINKLALQILDAIRKIKLVIAEQALNSEMSNGYYYKLSDEPLIGWRKDWKDKY